MTLVFVSIHQTQSDSGMAAGVSDRLWEMGDMVKLLEDFEAKRIETRKQAALTPPGAWT
jgi:hypothetical protein